MMYSVSGSEQPEHSSVSAYQDDGHPETGDELSYRDIITDIETWQAGLHTDSTLAR